MTVDHEIRSEVPFVTSSDILDEFLQTEKVNNITIYMTIEFRKYCAYSTPFGNSYAWEITSEIEGIYLQVLVQDKKDKTKKHIVEYDIQYLYDLNADFRKDIDEQVEDYAQSYTI